MSADEITQSVLRFLEIITRWQLILLILVILLRRELAELLPVLTRRITKASVGSASVEFSGEAINAFKETVQTGVDERRERPDEAVAFTLEQLQKLVQSASPQEKPARPLEGRSILWVDDRPSANAYERNYLKELGAKITQVTSTRDAEAMLDRSSFDVIISDVHRVEEGRENPRAGYDLLKILRDNQRHIPAVLYTRSAQRKLREPEVVAYGARVTDRPDDLIDNIVDLIGH